MTNGLSRRCIIAGLLSTRKNKPTTLQKMPQRITIRKSFEYNIGRTNKTER